MQMGVDVDMIDNYLKKKELLDNCDIMKKNIKIFLIIKKKNIFIFLLMDYSI